MACEKVTTVGTDENLFILVPVPGHGAQIGVQAPTKGYVQTGACTQVPSLNWALKSIACVPDLYAALTSKLK